MSLPEPKHYVSAPSGFGPLPFSSGVLAGNTFHLAGHIGFDPATGKAPADAEKEIHLMLDFARTTLGKVGLTMDDLVSVQIFCTDLSLYETFNAVYTTYFEGNLSARAFLGAGSLLLGARFEMVGIAVKHSL